MSKAFWAQHSIKSSQNSGDKKPGEIATEKRLASAREAEMNSRDPQGNLPRSVRKAVQAVNEAPPSGMRGGWLASSEEKETESAKRAHNRQKNLREKGSAY